jgi:phosphate transport system protein
MGSLALDQVRSALRAYADWNRAEARSVFERERALNAYDHALDEQQLALLARRSPVASDLRRIISFSKAVSELERVGDEAKKIARVVSEEERPAAEVVRDVLELGRHAQSLLQRALVAFDELDSASAADIVAADEDLDREYDAAMGRLVARAAPDSDHIRLAVRAAFVLKSLERIGDHARNLARLLQG